jgi:hypothetical protein
MWLPWYSQRTLLPNGWRITRRRAERSERSGRLGKAHVGRQRFADFLLEEPFILVMRTNPKPRYRVAFQQSKRSVSQTNAH